MGRWHTGSGKLGWRGTQGQNRCLPCYTSGFVSQAQGSNSTATTRSFLSQEQLPVGWRFWLLWVLATNAGFFLGIAVELLLLGRITNAVAVPLAGVGQALVLNRHIPTRWTWAVASALGWWVGMLLAAEVLRPLAPQLSFWPHAMLFALVAGTVVGMSTLWVLRRAGLHVGWWWVPLSGVAWGVQFPGMVTGVVLTRLLRATR